MRVWGKRFVIGLVALVILVAGSVGVLLGTQWGTQRLLAWVEPVLPEALGIGDVQGTVLGGLVIRDSRWQTDDQLATVDYLQLAIEFLPLLSRRVAIETLNVQGVTVKLSPSTNESTTGNKPFGFTPLPVDLLLRYGVIQDVSVSVGDSAYELNKITLQGELRDVTTTIDRLLVEGTWVELDVNGRAKLVEPFTSRLNGEWWLQWEDARYAGDLTLSGDWQSFDLNHHLLAPYDLTSEGRISVATQAIDMVHEFQTVALPATDYEFKSGSLFTRGTFSNLLFEMQTMVQSEVLSSSLLQANGSVTSEGAEFTSLSLTGAQGDVQGRGAVTWTNGLVQWNGVVNGDSINLALIDASVDGLLSLDVNSVGQYQAESGLNTQLDIKNLQGTLNGLPVTGGGTVQVQDDLITANAVSLSSGQNSVAVNGTLNEALDVALDLRQLKDLDETLGGSLVGKVRMTGDLSELKVSADVVAQQLTASGLSLAQGRLVTAGDGLSHDLSVTDLTVGTTTVDEAEVTLVGDLTQHEVEGQLRAGANAATWSVSGQQTIEGWTGTLASMELDVAGGTWVLQESVQLTVEQSRQRISEFCFTGPATARACGTIEKQLSPPQARIDLDFQELPLFPLLATIRPDLEGTGELSGTAALVNTSSGLAGNVALLSKNGQLTVVTEQIEESQLPFVLDVSGELTENQLISRGLLTVGEAGELSLRLSLPDVTDEDAQLQGEVDLSIPDVSFLSLFIPNAQVTAGSLAGQLAIRGPRNEPLLSGEAQLAAGKVYLPDVGSTLDDLQLTLTTADGRQRYDIRGSAETGDGQVSVTGYVDRMLGWKTEVELKGKDVALVKLPDLQVTSQLDLDVGYDAQTVVIEGEISIPNAFIALEELPENAVTPADDTVVHREEDPESSTMQYQLALDVNLEDQVHLKGFGLDSNLAGALKLKGDHESELSGTGTLNLVNGKFVAYGQELEITQGSLLFTGPLNNPILDVRAIREVGDTTVGVQISGTATRPQSSLFSDPPLPDADTLAYLITGRPIDQTGSQEGGQLLSAALALGVSKNLATELRSTLGLDELTVTGSGEDGQVLAGKRLGNRLYLQYAFGIFDNIGNVLLRYTLTDRLTFESESGEEQSLDLFYSVKKP